MFEPLIGISVLVNLGACGAFLWYAWDARKAKVQSKADREEQTATLVANFQASDSQVQSVLDLVQKISRDLLTVANNQVTLGNNQVMEITEHRALQKQFSDLAYATRVLNAAAKKEAAEAAARGNVSAAEALKLRRESMREAAEKQDRMQKLPDAEARNKASGLIAPGKLPPRGTPQNPNYQEGNL
jgi:hypothetical protein